MTQLALFAPAGERLRVNFLCIYERCQRRGTAYAGAWVDLGGCRNRDVWCDTCPARGCQSERAISAQAKGRESA